MLSLLMTMPLEDDLASAAATGNTDRVKILLRRGVDVNGVNCFGRTPLQVSVSRYALVVVLIGEDRVVIIVKESKCSTVSSIF